MNWEKAGRSTDTQKCSMRTQNHKMLTRHNASHHHRNQSAYSFIYIFEKANECDCCDAKQQQQQHETHQPKIKAIEDKIRKSKS